tara:strand:+ start:182 stop:454 length:273 start_codon:yes stop_codon:yes gene_type:complete
MNGRKAKKIRNKSLLLLVDWVKGLVSDAEKQNVDINKAKDLLPTDTHFYANQQIMLSAYSLKWIVKKVKRLSKVKSINNITIEDLNNDKN